MRANIASGATASTTPARIMCVLLALPAIICAPPVPPAFNGGDNAVEQIPGHYLRHVVSENYDHDIIDGRNDSFLMSFFARLRSTTQVGDDTDMDDRGKDQIVDPLRIEDDVSDYSERRLQPSSPKWCKQLYRSHSHSLRRQRSVLFTFPHVSLFLARKKIRRKLDQKHMRPILPPHNHESALRRLRSMGSAPLRHGRILLQRRAQLAVRRVLH
mmetsp:Transcript_128/g.295  ORF Transcript_128/g.295 Transcript_128/m.295 type:complete len:214 (+) Transcript_128:191-832(+)